jgi:hypothetical protein
MSKQNKVECYSDMTLSLEEQMLLDEIMSKDPHPFAFINEFCTKLKFNIPTVNVIEFTKPTSQYKTTITLMNGVFGEEFGSTKKKSKSNMVLI